MSFDFGQALRPDHVIKCSFGNDSIALMRWLYEYNERFHSLGKVVVLYNETGWAANWWPARVTKGEDLARQYGFIPVTTPVVPGAWKALLFEHNTWPDRLRRFCTQKLKVLRTHAWLNEHDPEGKAVMCCGVRREESFERKLWPEWLDSSPSDEGRSAWAPLVYLTSSERDELIRRAGWEPLPHRSRECRCVLANSADICTWSEEDIKEIEQLETELGKRNQGTNKFMFHPHRKKGNPEGIRAVVQWAKNVQANKALREAEAKESSGCDSGYCEA